MLRDAEDADVGGVHDADEKSGNSGRVVGEVPSTVGEVRQSEPVAQGHRCGSQGMQGVSELTRAVPGWAATAVFPAIAAGRASLPRGQESFIRPAP
jgi:hypothetical protein